VTATDYVLIGTVLALLLFSVFKSMHKTKKALKVGAKQFWNVLPFFVAVFGLIGLLEVLLTPAIVKTWLGSGSGILAPLYAAVFGGMATGPPAAVFPLGKYLLTQQASVAAVSTLLIAWVAVGTVTLPAEIRFFGARFALTRWALAFVLSIALGLTMGVLM
jgi:uncharacterized membrane protein YraQ (UPF0718 family)